jgi:hypothetical protein
MLPQREKFEEKSVAAFLVDLSQLAKYNPCINSQYAKPEKRKATLTPPPRRKKALETLNHVTKESVSGYSVASLLHTNLDGNEH